jgi:class 3 adenylate cyclase
MAASMGDRRWRELLEVHDLLGEDVGWIAVAIAARLTSLASSDEVVVSSTVKDLVAGSGIRFEDRGIHALKGVPEEWHIFAVQPT